MPAEPRHADPAEAALIAHLARGSPPPPPLDSLASPELDLLRSLCRGSPLRARLVASHLLPLLGGRTLSYNILPPPPDPPNPSTPQAPIPPTPPPRPQGSDPDISHIPPAPPASWSAALASAEAEVLRLAALEEDLAVFGPLLGVGWHRVGTALSQVVHDRLDELSALLARAPELRRVAELLGRLREGTRPRRHPERGGRDEAVGVTLGAELADALPSELALLATPETEDLFLARLLERRLVSLELTGPLGPDPAGLRRGPVLCLVDTSGSMMGAPAEFAKATALAVIERVLADHRPVEVTLFGGEGSTRTLRFARGRTSLGALFDFLMASFHGGTDFDGPLLAALDRVRPGPPAPSTSFADADLLVVTDGRGRLAPTTRARLAAARKAGLRLVTALVAAGPEHERPDPHGLAAASDRVLAVSPEGRVAESSPPARPR